MVHALERTAGHLAAHGVCVLIQPHRTRRPFIAVVARGRRVPIGGLVNPAFQPLIDAANDAIASVVDRGLLKLLNRSNHQFSVRFANPSQLHRYLHNGQRPPRFPPGARKRLMAAWTTGSDGGSARWPSASCWTCSTRHYFPSPARQSIWPSVVRC